MTEVPFIHLSAVPLVDTPDIAVVSLATSAPVLPWGLEDLAVVNAIVDGLAEERPGRVWTFRLIPNRAGSFTVAAPADALHALDGTPAAASNRLIRYHEPPVATIIGPRPVMDGPVELTVHWSKPVQHFDPASLLADGLALEDATQSDAQTWTLRATPLLQPTEVAVVAPAGMATDALGTPSAPSRWHSYAIAPAPLPVRPILEHVRAEEDGTFTAVWGYLNDNPARTVRIPAGPDNRFVPGPPDQGQPELFLPGRQVAVFQTPFAGGSLVWSLRSPNGSQRSATAGAGAAS